MYTFVKALMLKRSRSTKWVDVDIMSLNLKDLIDTYSEGIITLNNPYLGGEIHITLDTVIREGVRVDKTFQWWLANLEDRVIDYTTKDYKVVTNIAGYRDGYDAKYQIRNVKYSVHPDTDLPLSSRPDLLLTNRTVSREDITNYGLVAVNGYFHRTFSHPQGVIVESGGETMRISQDNYFGVWSFANIGKVESLAIRPHMISPSKEDALLKDGLVINTELDLSGKTIGVSIGGVIHLLDGTVSVIDDERGLVYLDITKVDMMSRILDQIDHISLTSLPITTSSLNTRAVSYSDLMSDECITAYLGLPQSFLFTIETEGLWVDTSPYEYSGLAGTYFAYEPPRDLVRIPNGTSPAIAVSYETDRWVLNVDPALMDNYVARTSDYKDQTSFDPTPRIDRKHSRALLSRVRVGSTRIEWDD